MHPFILYECVPDRDRPGLDINDVSTAPCAPVGGEDGRGARSPPGDESTRLRWEGGEVTPSWLPRLGVRREAGCDTGKNYAHWHLFWGTQTGQFSTTHIFGLEFWVVCSNSNS